jgi:O-antigen ligase
MKQSEKLLLGRLLGWTALAATLLVMPWMAYDPINVPKLAVIAVGGFMALGMLLANTGALREKQFRPVLILCVLFVVDLIVVLILPGGNFYTEFFGTFGRATGFVAYFALAALMLAAVISSNAFTLTRFSRILIIAGGISIAYGIVQALDLDPLSWVNQYSPVIGFLGNPNFQSSFVGFCGIIAFAQLIQKNCKLLVRGGYFLYLITVVYVIKETDSQQGFLVLLGGVAMVVLIWIKTSPVKFLTIPSLIVGFIGVVLVTLGSLNSGPLASILYKLSVTYRGDYWRAGWKMTVEHPFFGVGLDSYGDWYRRARTVEATLRRGPDVTSNAAHNVLLDFSSNGGFPLMLIYLALMVLVVVSAIKVLQRSQSFDPVFSGLFALWIAFQAQSIISLNQLGLAVWGWIISGLIIGYEIITRLQTQVIKEPVHRNARSVKTAESQSIASKSLIGIFTGLLVGLVIGIPALNTSAKFKSALESGSVERLQAVTSLKPISCQQNSQIGAILINNKFESNSLVVLLATTKVLPTCFEAWDLITQNLSATAEQVATAKLQMKRLDPLNPDLK